VNRRAVYPVIQLKPRWTVPTAPSESIVHKESKGETRQCSNMGDVLALKIMLGDKIRVDAPNGISATGMYISSADNYLVWKNEGFPKISWQELTSVSVTKI
jgi:hypothetical protein